MMDNSELTLDLIHMLELLDKKTNLGKILNIVGTSVIQVTLISPSVTT